MYVVLHVLIWMVAIFQKKMIFVKGVHHVRPIDYNYGIEKNCNILACGSRRNIVSECRHNAGASRYGRVAGKAQDKE